MNDKDSAVREDDLDNDVELDDTVPGDATIRGETSDGCCAYCGKRVESCTCLE